MRPQFHQFSSKIASFQIRSAPQFHQFSSKIAHFQIRNFVRNGQISNKERGVPCRSCRVADSLFRPHPEQRARASREPRKTITFTPCLKLNVATFASFASFRSRGFHVPWIPPRAALRAHRGRTTWTPALHPLFITHHPRTASLIMVAATIVADDVEIHKLEGNLDGHRQK